MAQYEHCANCRFFQDYNMEDDRGFCRRYPPQSRGLDVDKFPIVTATMWCGDWMPADDGEAHEGASGYPI